uniref:Uncharacterized protein n=1 Tax=Arion vulgaris TaxID=1028688 RepID=A0A0B7BPC4_9EUPU
MFQYRHHMLEMPCARSPNVAITTQEGNMDKHMSTVCQIERRYANHGNTKHLIDLPLGRM